MHGENDVQYRTESHMSEKIKVEDMEGYLSPYHQSRLSEKYSKRSQSSLLNDSQIKVIE
jgi:hypothetical protein